MPRSVGTGKGGQAGGLSKIWTVRGSEIGVHIHHNLHLAAANNIETIVRGNKR